MAKLNLEGLSNYVDCLFKELDKQLSDKGYVILELGYDDVESDEVTEEIIKVLRKKYVVNYSFARTGSINHYIIVITKNSYLIEDINYEVLDLLYKDITDKVDKVTEEEEYYGCDIRIFTTLNLNLPGGIVDRLEGYKDSYNLKVHLEGKYRDNPRNLRVRWNEDWVHDYNWAKYEEFKEREERDNPPRGTLTGSDIMKMVSGEYYLIYGRMFV